MRLLNPYAILFSFFYLIILISTGIAQSRVNPNQAFQFQPGSDPDPNFHFDADPDSAFSLFFSMRNPVRILKMI